MPYLSAELGRSGQHWECSCRHCASTSQAEALSQLHENWPLMLEAAAAGRHRQVGLQKLQKLIRVRFQVELCPDPHQRGLLSLRASMAVALPGTEDAAQHGSQGN